MRGPDRLQIMKKGYLTIGISILIFIMPILFPFMAYGHETKGIPPTFQPLVQRLSQDGFDYEFLSKLFIDPRAELTPVVLTIPFYKKETKELYAQFLSEESILLSKKFLREHLKILRQMERNYQVEKEVIVAILLVESRFGEDIGQYRVIPTLAAMALLDSPDHLRKTYVILRENDPELPYEWISDLAKRRSDWAYRELKCFLKIIYNEKIDPLEVYGSYAGALGMAQFIPSSYLTYAVSRNSFEQWLVSKEEAIFSIGNYLKSHGWQKNLSAKKKKQILWYYNRSEPYIETILQVAQKIRPSSPSTKM